MKNFLTISILLLFISFTATAKEIPTLTGPVVDEARVITASTERKLDGALKRIYSKTGIQIQVYTTDSLKGEALEDFTIKVVDEWKLGKDREDKGILFFIAINDRKMRIEVGSGLEGQLTDLYAGRIIDKIKPFFKHNDYDGGVHFGVKLIANSVGQKLSTGRIRRSKKQQRLGFGAFLIISIMMMFLRTRRRGAFYCGGASGGSFGSSGGGSWSGGGGGFSGGGASGGW